MDSTGFFFFFCFHQFFVFSLIIFFFFFSFLFHNQIYTTWQLGHEGSLSMVMLWLQMPGNLLVIFFQGILNRSDISTWAPYFFQFIQQIVLLAMCYFFKLKRAIATDASELSLLTNGLEDSDVLGVQ